MKPSWVAGVAVLALVCGGCGAFSVGSRDSAGTAGALGERPEMVGRATAAWLPDVVLDPPDPTVIPAVRTDDATDAGDPGDGQTLAQAKEAGETEAGEAYDPWEPFNEKMFDFNHGLDQHVLKPVAKGYKTVVPDSVQIMVSNGFDNFRFVARVINNLLEGKWDGAVREFSRFLLNSSIGIGGLFDPAKTAGIKGSEADFGITLGKWGARPGPYLILPFLKPMTVRDGIGRGVDTVIDPFFWFVPFAPEGVSLTVGDTVNDRALNYELFQGVEETTIDLYAAVRHFYLRSREEHIKQ